MLRGPDRQRTTDCVEKVDLGFPGGRLVPEIEILKFDRDLWAQISRSDAQKRCFHRPLVGLFGQSDFLKRIDPWRTLDRGCG